jgi:hypothetical protein
MTSSSCWSPHPLGSIGPWIAVRPNRYSGHHLEPRESETMKRRNAAADGKRRPVKRTKLTDNIFGR